MDALFVFLCLSFLGAEEKVEEASQPKDDIDAEGFEAFLKTLEEERKAKDSGANEVHIASCIQKCSNSTAACP